MPKASVIITTHHRPHLLPNAISSAKSAARDIEIIVVDDASCDETARVCRSIPGINYLRVERNQGVAGARNVGLVVSCGEYITFLDDDDARLPQSLDQQIQLLEQNPQTAFAYGQAIPKSENGERGEAYPAQCPQGDIFWELLTQNFMPCGSVVFRRSVVSAIGLLDDAIAGIDDWDYWIRIAELFPVMAIKAPVMIWRQSTPSSIQGSSNTVDIIAMGSRHFRREIVNAPRFANASRTDQRRAWRDFSTNVSEHLAWEVFGGLRNGMVRHALQSARTLLALHPASLVNIFRHWMNAPTIAALVKSAASHDDVAKAKIHFKNIRSDIARQ